MDYLFLLGRILFGGYFIINGYSHFKNFSGTVGYAKSKGVPATKFFIAVTAILLILGGAGIVLGLFPHLAVILLLIFLIPVTFTMHRFWKVTDPMQKMGEYINFTKNIALIGATLIFLFITVWPLSV